MINKLEYIFSEARLVGFRHNCCFFLFFLSKKRIPIICSCLIYSQILTHHAWAQPFLLNFIMINLHLSNTLSKTSASSNISTLMIGDDTAKNQDDILETKSWSYKEIMLYYLFSSPLNFSAYLDNFDFHSFL